MDRRSFLKFLLATPIAAHLDVEKLLWIPGEKTVFLPPYHITEAQIVVSEWERILSLWTSMFERDDIFYNKISPSKIR